MCGEPLWNPEVLEQAITSVLDEAKQKQLERGLAQDGWLKSAKGAVVSSPTVYEKAVKVTGRDGRSDRAQDNPLNLNKTGRPSLDSAGTSSRTPTRSAAGAPFLAHVQGRVTRVYRLGAGG